MKQYHDLLKRVLGEGDVQYEPRTQEYILGVSAALSTYDLREGFPLVTTKNVPPRLPFEEVLWKLRGGRNVKPLVDRDIHIWDANAFDRYLKKQSLREKFPKHSSEWNEEFVRYQARIKTDPVFAAEAGDLGPVYGYQWRHGFKRGDKEVDQLKNMLVAMKEKPGSRYHVLNAWNPSDLPDMALGPCPFWHQFTIYGKEMDLTMVQRSCDVFLGVPFNIAQDSFLAHLVAQETGKQPRFFHHSLVNVHSYLGVPPRANFWTEGDNVVEFQRRFSSINRREDYLDLRDWYLSRAGSESAGNEKKDHVPFILTQLSKEPRGLPTIAVASAPFFDLIEKPANEVATVSGYSPHKWDSKAEMAA